MKWFLVGLVAVLGLAAIPIFMFVSAANQGNSMENQILAQVDANKTSLSTLTQTVLETAKVPGMFADDLREVIAEALEGRYGEGGTNAMFVAITEAYPGQLDSSLYQNIQLAISSGRADFAAEQRKLIGMVQAYKTKLGAIPDGFFLRLAGYPRLDLNETQFKPIVTVSTTQAFETGVDEGLKF